jgi:hypothetical protein
MNLAWYPKEMIAPPELTAVMLPKGEVSDKDWIEALSDRVSDLAMQESDPLKAAQQACLALELPLVDEANQLGDCVVKENLNLRTNLSCQKTKDPFPANLSESNQEALQAIKQTNLAQWVELAKSAVSVSSLD